MRIVEHDCLAAEHQQVPAVRRRQHVRVEDQRRRPVRDDPMVDRGDLLEALRGAGQVVGRGDDGLAPERLGFEEVHQLLLRRRVDAGDRLVEQVDLGVRGQGPGEEHAPSLATGQPPDLDVALVGHADLLEGLRDRRPVSRAGAAKRPERRIAAHHDDVRDGHRERPVDHFGLRHVGDPVGLLPRRIAEDLDPALPWRQQPGHQLEHGALARAVGPHDREQRSGLDRQVDLLERGPMVVARRHAAQPHRGVCPRVLRIGDRAVLQRRQPALIRMAMRVGVRVERPGHGWSASTTLSTSQRINPS
jgi:hypothetical protein